MSAFNLNYMKYYNKLSQKKQVSISTKLCLNNIQREKIKKSLCIGLEGGDWLTQFLLADMSAINLVFLLVCSLLQCFKKKFPFFLIWFVLLLWKKVFFCGWEGSTPTPSLLLVRPLKKQLFFLPLFNKNIFLIPLKSNFVSSLPSWVQWR